MALRCVTSVCPSPKAKIIIEIVPFERVVLAKVGLMSAIIKVIKRFKISASIDLKNLATSAISLRMYIQGQG